MLDGQGLNRSEFFATESKGKWGELGRGFDIGKVSNARDNERILGLSEEIEGLTREGVGKDRVIRE